jgi:DNA adenine methylase
MPKKITKDEYSEVRANQSKYPAYFVGWVGFNCSYSGKWFGGFAGEQKIQNKEKELQELLLKNGYQITGTFNYLGYNAPWDIVNRENDIVVKIDYKP